MVDGKPLDPHAIRLELTVPSDERFRPVLGVVCERLARYVGYSPEQAATLAGSVVHATDDVLGRDPTARYTNLDLTIATNDHEIEFRVRYHRGGTPSSATDQESVLTQSLPTEPS